MFTVEKKNNVLGKLKKKRAYSLRKRKRMKEGEYTVIAIFIVYVY